MISDTIHYRSCSWVDLPTLSHVAHTGCSRGHFNLRFRQLSHDGMLDSPTCCAIALLSMGEDKSGGVSAGTCREACVINMGLSHVPFNRPDQRRQ